MLNKQLMKKQQEALFSVDTLPVETQKKKFSVHCEVANGAMQAFVKVIAVEDDCGVTEFDILSKIYKKGIRINIYYDQITDIVDKNRINEKVLIAEGFSPEDGVDAEIVPCVELEEFMTPEMAKNFPGQRIVTGVEVDLDQPVMEKKPATPGVPGYTVRGRMIKPKAGTDAPFEYGQNLRISQDGLYLRAAMPGLAGLSGGKVEVRDHDYDEWRYEVKFRKNNMEAMLSIIPGIRQQPEHDEAFFNGLLSKHGISFGIEPMLHRRAPGKIRSTTVFRVASGEPPTRGSAAKINELFSDSTGKGELLYRVEKDQLIVEKTPPGKGTRGRNVLDEPVPAPEGADTELAAGENTRLSDDGLKLYSTIDGYVSRSKNAYCVVECMTIDNKTVPGKKIDYPGIVHVKGDVTAGSAIVAGHHIIVDGEIQGAEVVAGGSMKVAGYVRNCVKSKVQAGGDMFLGGVEKSRLLAGGGIYLHDGAKQVQMISGASVMAMNGNKCYISGGRVVATGDVELQVLGSMPPTPTSIEAGVPFAVRVRFEHTAQEFVQLVNMHASVTKQIAAIRDKAKASGISREEAIRYKKLMMAFEVLSEKTRLRGAKVKKVRDAVEKMSSPYRVVAHDIVNPGVTIKVGGYSERIDSSVKKSIFRIDAENKKLMKSRI